MHDTHRRTNFVKYECLRTMQCYTQTGRQAHHFFAQRTHAVKHTRVNERVKQDAQASVVKQGVRAHTPASTDACAHTRVRANAHMHIDTYAHPQPLREPCCALANNMKTQRRTRKYTYARLHSHTHTHRCATTRKPSRTDTSHQRTQEMWMYENKEVQSLNVCGLSQRCNRANKLKGGGCSTARRQAHCKKYTL